MHLKNLLGQRPALDILPDWPINNFESKQVINIWFL